MHLGTDTWSSFQKIRSTQFVYSLLISFPHHSVCVLIAHLLSNSLNYMLLGEGSIFFFAWQQFAVGCWSKIKITQVTCKILQWILSTFVLQNWVTRMMINNYTRFDFENVFKVTSIYLEKEIITKCFTDF